MLKKLLIIIFLVVSGFLVWGTPTQAGFGISPPYIRSDKIFPGSHYEQIVVLLRSSAEDDLVADITINAPEVEPWLSIDKGMSFDLPAGKLQVPMIVSVDVPGGTEVGNYIGSLNIRISPKNKQNRGGVAIALGARVEIDLTVTKEAYTDFLIRSIDVSNLEMLSKPWSWPIFSRFFYRLKVSMRVENTGNTKIAPSKVAVDVYDITEKKLLESGVDKRFKKVEPFQTSNVIASFPTKLGKGQYWAKIKIYKQNEVVRSDKVAFTVAPPGTYKHKLGIWPWVMLAGIILLILIIIFVLIKIKIWRYIFKLLYILSWPLRYLWRKFRLLLHALKIKFWRWLHRKSAKYKDVDSGIEPKDKQSSDKNRE
ncbi:MAG: hypothetical protein U9R06_01450 [Patescibacteria group bacterium]|nr:hypothetical protein [Patescibacteria group bacterium]